MFSIVLQGIKSITPITPTDPDNKQMLKPYPYVASNIYGGYVFHKLFSTC